MANADPSLKWRILSAIILAPAVLALVVWGVWPFALLAAVAVVLLAMEWRHLMAARIDRKTGDLAGFAAGGSALLVLAFAAMGRHEAALLVTLSGTVIAGVIAQLVNASVLWTSLGVLYLSIPMFAMVWLRAVPDIGLAILLWLLLVVWATDVMAYVVGRKVGGPKLAPSISPGKTWSGLFGGMAGAAAVGAIMSTFMAPFYLLSSIVLALGLAVVAQIGDLAESSLKRRAGVKDSGGLIPGHGGLFDRIDGLLFAAPVLALIMMIAGRQDFP
ncbi:MAG: phosphatidate cytidylyltransferase [Geminicoccaceae bacterium]